MLMIALVGADEQQRTAIADKIQAVSAHVSIFNMRYPTMPAERLTVLNKVLNTRSSDRQSLLLLSVTSEQEAQLLRDRGCIFAVVEGRPSDAVAINQEDLFVTDKSRAHRHYLTAESMFSEARAMQQKKRKL